MTWIAKVSKPGFNVLTTTTPDNLIFSSDYNTLKYYVSGSYNMTTNITVTQTIAHNLGYTPFFVVFVNDPVTNTTHYSFVEYFNSFGRFVAARAYVDSTNLYLSAIVTDGNTYTINWYYKIFLNKLGL